MNKKPLKVIAGTPDRPLVIGDVEIECYVLEDETRVLSHRGFLRAIGRTGRPVSAVESHVLQTPVFLRPTSIQLFVNSALVRASQPIKFQSTGGGSPAFGFHAELLPKVCEVYLRARQEGTLKPSQHHIADRCEIIVRGLATVGIIALVDEATGYQKIREKRALAKILEKFIAEELQPWTKTFPYQFYRQIFRLKRWPGPDGVKRPSIIGHYTNDIVYARIATGVLEELRKRNPTLPSGNRKDKHHQWFTPDLGHPKLKEHLAAVTALMRAAANWGQFQRSLKRAFPVLNDQYEMNLGDD